MSVLKSRIVNRSPGNDLTVIGTLNGPDMLPMTRVQIQPGTLTYASLETLIASDGAPVIAMHNGGYGTLVSAGRP